MRYRIKDLRKHFNLTQQEFADRLGVKRTTIATYESGRNEPIDAVISLICREFNVNEMWLRTGEGDMFAELDPEDEYIINLSRIDMTDNKFIQGMVRAIAKRSPEQLRSIEEFMMDVLGITYEDEKKDG